VGYGRVGQRIFEGLSEKGITIVVVEQNRELVETLRLKGFKAVAGEASKAEALVQAHVARAQVILVAIPDMFNVRKILEISQMLNPNINSIVRTYSKEDSDLLNKANVRDTFLSEYELAISMINRTLKNFESGKI
jgi:CPA2 family monovalent cation:H+ antiporter-2